MSNQYKPCLPLVHSGHWDAFNSLLNEMIENETAALINTVDQGMVRELQGRIKTLKKIKSIPVILNSLSKNQTI